LAKICTAAASTQYTLVAATVAEIVASTVVARTTPCISRIRQRSTTTYLQREVHIVALIACEPDKTVRLVCLENDFDALDPVSLQIVFGHLTKYVQDPLGAVKPLPEVIIGRQSCGSCCSCFRSRVTVDDDVDRKWCYQQQIEKIKISRQSVTSHNRLRKTNKQLYNNHLYSPRIDGSTTENEEYCKTVG